MASPSGKLFTRSGLWCLVAFLAVLVCVQAKSVKADGGGDGGGGGGCSNNVCSNPYSYAPAQFILVHGMGGGAWFWFEIILLLESYGSKVITVDLTSHGINKASADDVTTLKDYAKPLTDAIEGCSGSVIVVGHSLSGGLAAYVSEKYPTKVSKAIYIAAVMPTNGQYMFQGYPSGTFPNLIKKGFLSFNSRRDPSSPSSATLSATDLKKFYMSETPDRYIALSKLLFCDTPFVPGTEVLGLTPANFGTVRRFFIKTLLDKTVSVADQEAMIAANPPEKVFCMWKADHAPFFSQPGQLASILMCISGQ